MNNKTKETILLLLFSGLALAFSRNSRQHYRIYKNLGKEWQRIHKGVLKREISSLYRSKLIKEQKNSDGSYTIVLSDKGRAKTLTYYFANIKIDTKNWDGKWRTVFFDVPEKYRWGRDVLRRKLRELGFYEIQKSVFMFPYHCEDEMNFIIEYYGMRKHVRYGVLDYIDNDAYLRNHFKLKVETAK